MFRGRLVADGMLVTHLVWSIWSLGCLATAAWFFRLALAASASGRAQDLVGLSFNGLLLTGTGVALLWAWRLASGAIVLRSDGLWYRPFLRGRLVPYGNIKSLDAGTRSTTARDAASEAGPFSSCHPGS